MGVGVQTKKPRLYIRLPCKIKDEHQIQELNSNIIAVHLPRQKSRRWCTVEFENLDSLEDARKSIKKLKIAGKSLVVKPFRLTGKENQNKTI